MQNVKRFEHQAVSGNPKLVFLCKVCGFTGQTSGFPTSCPKCGFNPIKELEKQREERNIFKD